jgi:hypothetical protein
MNGRYDIEGANGFSEKRISLTEDYGCPPLIEKGVSFYKSLAEQHLDLGCLRLI